MHSLSSWSFDQNVSHIFDTHVRQSVPGYTQIQELVSQLSDFFLDETTPIIDLGCSTGETIARISARHHGKALSFIAIDESEAMIASAKEKLSFYDNINFVTTSVEEYAFDTHTNFVTAILMLQFCPVEKRPAILGKIYQSLKPGGALVLVEKAYPSHPQSHDIFTQLYHDMKEKNGLSPLEIREKDKSLRSRMVPLTLDTNLALLQEIGFNTDIFYKNLNFTGILALKHLGAR